MIAVFSPGSVQSRILGLLGLYLLDQAEPTFLTTRFFLDVLCSSGVTAIAVRTTLTRMVERGLLRRSKNGRTTSFAITDTCAVQLAHGRNRVFSPCPFGFGEDSWTFLFFMLPAYGENSRYQIQTRLAWAGFGAVDPRFWIAPGRIDAITLLTDILPTETLDNLQVFHGQAPDPSRFSTLIQKTWNIEAIRAAHLSFWTRWDNEPLLPESSPLLRLVELVNDWTLLLRSDPGLPPTYFDAEWNSERSRATFAKVYAQLRPEADRQFERMVKIG